MVFELQNLHVEFATMLRDYDYEYLTLYGDNQKTIMVTVLNIGDPYRTKLAYNWGEFCEFNNFKSREIIQSRLDVTSLNKRYHVYKFLFP